MDESQIFEQNRGLLIAAARRFASRFEYDVDDAIQNGSIGMLDGIRTYDASRGVPLSAWLSLRISGALLDGLRRERVQAIRRKGYGAVEFVYIDRPFQDRSTRASQGGPNQDARSQANVTPELAVEPDVDNPRRELPAPVLAALANLPERWRRAVELYYWHDMEQSEIARELGVSDGRVSQILRAAHQRIRESYTPKTAAA